MTLYRKSVKDSNLLPLIKFLAIETSALNVIVISYKHFYIDCISKLKQIKEFYIELYIFDTRWLDSIMFVDISHCIEY